MSTEFVDSLHRRGERLVLDAASWLEEVAVFSDDLARFHARDENYPELLTPKVQQNWPMLLELADAERHPS